MDRPSLFYDRDCGFCVWSLNKVLAWSRGRLDPIPLQSDRAAEALAGIPEGRRMESWHLVLPDGSVFSAGAAVPELMRYLPGVRPLAPVAKLFVRPIDVLYRMVARNRHRLGTLIGAKACAVPRPGEAPSKP